MADHPHLDKLTLIAEDIYNIEPAPFDLIILRDVIEHIHNQERFMGFLKRFIAPGGVVFFGFPAWTSRYVSASYPRRRSSICFLPNSMQG